MPTDARKQSPEQVRDDSHAHATDADLSGSRRDSEKDTATPQPGEGSKNQSGTKDGTPEAELGHS